MDRKVGFGNADDEDRPPYTVGLIEGKETKKCDHNLFKSLLPLGCLDTAIIVNISSNSRFIAADRRRGCALRKYTATAYGMGGSD